MITRYVHVYHESVIANAPALRVCARAKSDKNPHTHLTVLQVELNEDGQVLRSAVSKDMHQKEVLEMTKELSKNGVRVELPSDLEKRLMSEVGSHEITLCRENIKGQQPQYFLDVREAVADNSKTGKMLNFIDSFDDSLSGYKRAHSAMLLEASLRNLPYRDYVGAAVLTGEEVSDA